MCRISSFLSQSFPGTFKQQQTVSPNLGPIYHLSQHTAAFLIRGLKELFWGILYLLFYRPYSFAAPSKPGIPDAGIPLCSARFSSMPAFTEPVFFLSGWFFKDRCRVLLSSGRRIKSNFQKPFFSVTIRQFWEQMADHFLLTG